jgi:hypothetical protein
VGRTAIFSRSLLNLENVQIQLYCWGSNCALNIDLMKLYGFFNDKDYDHAVKYVQV